MEWLIASHNGVVIAAIDHDLCADTGAITRQEGGEPAFDHDGLHMSASGTYDIGKLWNIMLTNNLFVGSGIVADGPVKMMVKQFDAITFKLPNKLTIKQ